VQLVKEIYGWAVFWLYNLCTFLFYVSIATWHATLFVYPPWDNALAAVAVLFVADTLAFVGLSGSEISMEKPDWKFLRLSRIATVSGMWIEFGTDLASGVTAWKQGLYPVAACILVVGASSSSNLFRNSYLQGHIVPTSC
jgi:hypothetical protein